MRTSMDISELSGHIYRGDIEAVRHLIQSGCDVNEVDEDGRTPLMDAILNCDCSSAMVQLLLENGASVNVADKVQHWTSLHFASRDGKPVLVSLLLKRGARVDAVDVYGNTPLLRALTAHQNVAEVITLLLEAGANPHLRNKTGVSPLELAKRLNRSELIALLDKDIHE